MINIMNKVAERVSTLTAERWAEAALQAIAEGGVAALSVEALAKELGVTKGSFYWHFSNRRALIKAAVELWARRDTEEVLARADREPDPRRRIEAVVAESITGKRRASLYLALAAATSEVEIGPVFQRAVERRISYLARCFEELGFSVPRHRALVAFSEYVGIMHTIRDAPESMPKKPDFDAFVRVAIDTVIPR